MNFNIKCSYVPEISSFFLQEIVLARPVLEFFTYGKHVEYFHLLELELLNTQTVKKKSLLAC